MIKTILIANRGEIACRIIKTARNMGLTTISVFSDVDTNAEHVHMADQAFCLGASDSTSSYLNIDKILSIAKQHYVDAIHPGYGFLAENAEFARRCLKEKISFIGPSADIIELMGDKARAKNYLSGHNIPMVPGYTGDKQTPSYLQSEADKIGYPVLLKAACGGGGKGMRVVNEQNEFQDALTQAKDEAKKNFGDDRIILEKYLDSPRHIEVQIISDNQGNHVHLFERDCSIQRRHQKVVEEAPAPNISKKARDKLTETAINIAKAVNYTNAGTIEFLFDSNEQCYFMEMNTRLQVEHPVTEMITGIDLVEWQIKIAAGEPLPLAQKAIKQQGHAIEVRLYAEDPDNHFLPSIGKITVCDFPKDDPAIRIDTGVITNNEITAFYDPMIAKIITHGESRSQAIAKMNEALSQCYLHGIKTNIQYLAAIINSDAFEDEQLSTNFLQAHSPTLDAQLSDELIVACAVAWHQLQPTTRDNNVWQQLTNWRLNHTTGLVYDLTLNKQHYHSTLTDECILIGEQKYMIQADLTGNQLEIIHNDQTHHLHVVSADNLLLWHDGQKYEVAEHIWGIDEVSSDASDQQITAPMPGTIVSMHVNQGDKVAKGDKLLVMEAMKMQHTLTAPSDGLIKSILCQSGDFVKESTELMELE